MGPGQQPAFPNVSNSAGGHSKGYLGMTLRDWFASQALGAVKAEGSNEAVAQAAYSIADAMIKERQDEL